MKSLRMTFTTVVGACLIAGMAANLSCQPRSMYGYDIQKLFAESDLVIIGTAEKTETLREWSAPAPRGVPSESMGMETVSTLVRVEKTYKGSCDEIVDVRFDVSVSASSANPGPALYQGERSLLFLKASRNETYYFADRLWGKLSVDGISLTASGSGPDALEHDLNRTLSGGDAGNANAFRLLMGYKEVSLSTESTLSRLAAQSDPDTAMQAFSIMLASGQPRYFADALQFLRASGNCVKPLELLTLSGRIREFGIHADPLTIVGFSDLPFFAIQYAALDVLMEMKSPMTAEAVVRHFDDPDPEIQYQSLYVLREIVDKPGQRRGPEYSPSKPEFDKDPKHYTGLWKTLLEKEGETEFPRRNQ